MKRIIFALVASVCSLAVSFAGQPKYIALTFDDGPSLTVTTRILDVLEQNDATATFFVRGNRIDEETSKVMQRAHLMGCEIGNHSWSHPHFSKQSEDRIKAEIEMTNEMIERYIGEKPRFLRPPFYEWDDRVTAATDMTLIGGYCPNDFRNDVDVQKRIELTLGKAKDGMIILCHDSGLNHMTAEAMEVIIPELIARGFTLVTVSELFRIKFPEGQVWEHGHIYHNL